MHRDRASAFSHISLKNRPQAATAARAARQAASVAVRAPKKMGRSRCGGGLSFYVETKRILAAIGIVI